MTVLVGEIKLVGREYTNRTLIILFSSYAAIHTTRYILMKQWLTFYRNYTYIIRSISYRLQRGLGYGMRMGAWPEYVIISLFLYSVFCLHYKSWLMAAASLAQNKCQLLLLSLSRSFISSCTSIHLVLHLESRTQQ